MAEGFMGRLAGYEGALDRLAVEGEAAALRAALRRNVFGTLPEAEGDLAGLVAYVLAQAAALDAQPGEALRLGRVAFAPAPRSAEHTSELQSLMRISYAVFYFKKNTNQTIP